MCSICFHRGVGKVSPFVEAVSRGGRLLLELGEGLPLTGCSWCSAVWPGPPSLPPAAGGCRSSFPGEAAGAGAGAQRQWEGLCCVPGRELAGLGLQHLIKARSALPPYVPAGASGPGPACGCPALLFPFESLGRPSEVCWWVGKGLEGAGLVGTDHRLGGSWEGPLPSSPGDLPASLRFTPLQPGPCGCCCGSRVPSSVQPGVGVEDRQEGPERDRPSVDHTPKQELAVTIQPEADTMVPARLIWARLGRHGPTLTDGGSEASVGPVGRALPGPH